MTKSILFIVQPGDISTKTTDYLRTLGYSVNIQTNLKDALPMIAQLAYELIIVSVPSLDSQTLVFARSLISKFNRRVAILSRSNDPDLAEKSEEIGAKFFVNLPVSRNRWAVLLNKYVPLKSSIEQFDPGFERAFSHQVQQGKEVPAELTPINFEDIAKDAFHELVPAKKKEVTADTAKQSEENAKEVGQLLETIKSMCKNMMDKAWDTDLVYNLMKKMSRYYKNARVVIGIYSFQSDDIRIAMDTNRVVHQDLGSPLNGIFNEQVAEHIGRMFRDSHSEKGILVAGQKNYYPIPMFANERFSCILFLAREGDAVLDHQTLLNEIHGVFELGKNIRKSVMGKQRLLEMYLEYYAQKQAA